MDYVAADHAVCENDFDQSSQCECNEGWYSDRMDCNEGWCSDGMDYVVADNGVCEIYFDQPSQFKCNEKWYSDGMDCVQSVARRSRLPSDKPAGAVETPSKN